MCLEPTAPKVLIAPACLRAIAKWSRRSQDGLETGGALFGLEQEGECLEILHATDAGPQAKRRRDYFERDLAYTRSKADKLYALDGSEWVGEWHTHLHAELTPSVLDLTTYKKHLEDPELRFERFVSIIVGPVLDWSKGMLWIIEGCFAVGWEVSLK